LRWLLKAIVTVCNVLAVAVIALDASNALDHTTSFFKPTPKEVVVAIGAVALAAIYGLIDAWLERRISKRLGHIAMAVSELLFPLWNEIALKLVPTTESPDPLPTRESLGVSAWLVPRWYTVFTKSMPKFLCAILYAPPVWRAAQFRLKHLDDPTGIRWRRNRGIIGRCWKSGHSEPFNLATDWPQINTKQEWGQLDKSVKMKLSYDDYRHLKAKYGSVLAVPILRTRRIGAPSFLGCITIDLPPAVPANVLDLNSPVVKGAGRAAAEQMARVL
jgi:hypothetical protein